MRRLNLVVPLLLACSACSEDAATSRDPVTQPSATSSMSGTSTEGTNGPRGNGTSDPPPPSPVPMMTVDDELPPPTPSLEPEPTPGPLEPEPTPNGPSEPEPFVGAGGTNNGDAGRIGIAGGDGGRDATNGDAGAMSNGRAGATSNGGEAGASSSGAGGAPESPSGCEDGPLDAPIPGCEPEFEESGDFYPDCVARINQLRWECQCLPPLERWEEAEDCADQQAQYDYEQDEAHAGISAGICEPGGGSQNECPDYSPNFDIVNFCLQQMWDEGPGEPYIEHGHYINMSDPNITKVACGLYVTPEGNFWSVQNFSR
jgi:hypothetical protein